MHDECLVVDLGRRDYLETWELQKRLAARRLAGEIHDVLLFVEHPPTYTLGRNAKSENLLVPRERLLELGATVVETNRGGDVTFHGPGQLVGYPIVDLRKLRRDVTWYVRSIEEVLIRALRSFGIEAGRVSGRTGVWHSEGKLAAIGIHISRWVTSHGFALNVSTDLRYFDRIVPCGIVGAPVTSLEKVMKRELAPAETSAVKSRIASEWGFVFGRLLTRQETFEAPDGQRAAS